jgi:hypothetical protein
MPSTLSARDPVAKTERGFCSSVRAEKKPLSDFENSPPFAQNLRRKKTW